jgi:hypothetical protein
VTIIRRSRYAWASKSTPTRVAAASLDKAVTVTGTIKENALRGTLGPGGLPLKIQTGDGAIRLTGL